MSRALVVIRNPDDRRRCEQMIARTMPGDRVEFKRSRRSPAECSYVGDAH